MANSTAEISRAETHYRLTHNEWMEALRLKPRERDVLFYLRTLDPWGDRELDLTIRQIAEDLSTPERRCSPGTVSEALKSLNKLGWIDLELERVKVRLRSRHSQETTTEQGSQLAQEQYDTCGKSDRSSDQRSLERSVIAGAIAKTVENRSLERSVIAGAISDRWSDHAEGEAVEEMQEFSTEKGVLPKQTDLFCLKQTGSEPVENWPTADGFIDNEVDLLRVSQEEAYSRIQELTGLPINPPLRAVIQKLGRSSPERLEGRVTAAINSFLEQRPTIRNPQAFLSAALQSGYTSNDWKQKQRPSVLPEKQSRANFPAAAVAAAAATPRSPADLSRFVLGIRYECERLKCTIGEALELCHPGQTSLTNLTDEELKKFYLDLKEI